jgi:hypothetical protein
LALLTPLFGSAAQIAVNDSGDPGSEHENRGQIPSLKAENAVLKRQLDGVLVRLTKLEKAKGE